MESFRFRRTVRNCMGQWLEPPTLNGYETQVNPLDPFSNLYHYQGFLRGQGRTTKRKCHRVKRREGSRWSPLSHGSLLGWGRGRIRRRDETLSEDRSPIVLVHQGLTRPPLSTPVQVTGIVLTSDLESLTPLRSLLRTWTCTDVDGTASEVGRLGTKTPHLTLNQRSWETRTESWYDWVMSRTQWRRK